MGIVLALALCLVVGVVVVVSIVGRQAAQREQEESAPTEEELAEQAAAERVAQIVDQMTLEQKVAQLFVVRPEAITGVEVATEAGQTTREAISDFPVCGLLYSQQNLVDESQVQSLLKSTQNYVKDSSGLPALTCVEEEGGTSGPLSSSYLGADDVKGAAELGEDGDAEAAREAARQIGEGMQDLGFNTTFAPVADIVSSADAELAERSFGNEPEQVASMVVAQVDGYANSGVLCAVKHFPGTGEAEPDLHNGRLYSHRTRDELLERELVPFAEAIDADVPIVVVSSMSCLEVGNGEGDLPSWMSKEVVSGLLRDELHFDGVAMTDLLDDEAIADACDPSEQAVRALEAGMDVMVCPQDFERAYHGLLKAVERGQISEERLDESVTRVVRLKDTLSS